MNKFYSALAGVLEVDEVGPDTVFRDVPDWCSLKAFGILVMMENDWGAPLTIDRFADFTTAKDLYREAFLSFMAGVFGVKRENVDENAKYGEFPQWDSVNHLRLVMESEKRFGIEFPMERIPLLSTVDEFLV